MKKLMDDTKKLLSEILEEYRTGKLEVPSLPEVAIKIRNLIQDPDATAVKVAKVVQLDPALAARLIQVANSPLYRVSNAVEDCRGAVSRLGMTVTQNLVTGFAIKEVFKAETPVIKDIQRNIWNHSSRVAAISHVLARLTPGISPDRALLAGLVHDIGGLPILRYAESYPDIRKDRKLLTAMIDKLSGKLGKMVLDTWDFDDELSGIPASVEDWEYQPDDEASYADVVIIAHVHSMFGTDEGYNGPPLAEVSSFRKFPFSALGPDASIEIVQEAKGDIDMMTGMLSG